MLDTTLTVAAVPLAEVRGVRKTYSNGVLALDGIDLNLPQAPQFLALLGPSGCGKSTLLRLLAGLDEPSEGEINWHGSVGGERERNLGFVFQEPTLMPWSTVFDNVALPLRIQGLQGAPHDDRIRALLAKVGLDRFERAYPRELSGGMRMRASVARALVTNPRILLMDEPFAALDEITRLKLERDLLDLWLGSTLTVVFVTHSVFEAVFLASRIIVMTPRPGRIATDISVDAPYPRTEAFRTSAAYIDICRDVSAALAKAMGSMPL